MLQEPGSYVGEVVKVMGKSKVLVKVCWVPFASYLCDLSSSKNIILGRQTHIEYVL